MEVGGLASFHKNINYKDVLLFFFFYDYKSMLVGEATQPFTFVKTWVLMPYSSRPEPQLPVKESCIDVCVLPGHNIQLPAYLDVSKAPHTQHVQT